MSSLLPSPRSLLPPARLGLSSLTEEKGPRDPPDRDPGTRVPPEHPQEPGERVPQPAAPSQPSRPTRSPRRSRRDLRPPPSPLVAPGPAGPPPGAARGVPRPSHRRGRKRLEFGCLRWLRAHLSVAGRSGGTERGRRLRKVMYSRNVWGDFLRWGGFCVGHSRVNTRSCVPDVPLLAEQPDFRAL